MKLNKRLSCWVIALTALLSITVHGNAETKKTPGTSASTSTLLKSPVPNEDHEQNGNGFNQGDVLQASFSVLTIVELLGEGAFGKVYSVVDESGNKYAIKHYKHEPNRFGNDHEYNDADREFQRGQLLDHPYILKSVDLFSHIYKSNEESLVLVLEFVDGQPLFKVKRSTFTKEQVVDAIMNLVDALKYAMTFNLFHLDLHAGNVMIDADNHPKVIDLASFFELDELISSLPNTCETIKPTNDKRSALQGSKRMLPAKNVIWKASKPQHPKIAKFIQEHPEVVKQLAKRVAVEKEGRKGAGKPLMRKSLTSNVTDSDDRICLTDSTKAPIQSYYFNMISDMCATMLYLSDLDKDQKINLHAEIKKIAWSYDYDVKEGLSPDFDEYFDQLTTLLMQP